MRQIFTSPRLETVEGVAALLKEHGIQTWLSEARSYRGNRRREFSYRDDERSSSGQNDPAVWIVHTDDLTRARALLREAGLLETTRGGTDSYLPQGAGSTAATPRSPYRLAGKLRLGLLAAVAMLAMLTFLRGCATKPKTPPVDESHIIVIESSPD